MKPSQIITINELVQTLGLDNKLPDIIERAFMINLLLPREARFNAIKIVTDAIGRKHLDFLLSTPLARSLWQQDELMAMEMKPITSLDKARAFEGLAGMTFLVVHNTPFYEYAMKTLPVDFEHIAAELQTADTAQILKFVDKKIPGLVMTLHNAVDYLIQFIEPLDCTKLLDYAITSDEIERLIYPVLADFFFIYATQFQFIASRLDKRQVARHFAALYRNFASTDIDKSQFTPSLVDDFAKQTGRDGAWLKEFAGE